MNHFKKLIHDDIMSWCADALVVVEIQRTGSSDNQGFEARARHFVKQGLVRTDGVEQVLPSRGETLRPQSE